VDRVDGAGAGVDRGRFDPAGEAFVARDFVARDFGGGAGFFDNEGSET